VFVHCIAVLVVVKVALYNAVGTIFTTWMNGNTTSCFIHTVYLRVSVNFCNKLQFFFFLRSVNLELHNSFFSKNLVAISKFWTPEG